MESLKLHLQNPRRRRPSSVLSLVLVLFLSFHVVAPLDSTKNATALVVVDVDVGLILDLDTVMGKMIQTCIAMAITDFYGSHTHSSYNTRIVLHTRDSKSDIVDATTAAIDLLKNVQVQAIMGPQRSTQADFVIDIGTKTQVPIVSPATSPSLSPKESPYFVRAAQNSSSQAKAIAAIVKAFSWREVVLIYEDNDYGSGIVPYLTDELLEVSAKVPYRSVLSPLASDDHILQELYKLKTMQTRVFVVHLLPPLSSRLFLKAKEAGMIEKGYAWIITDVLTGLLESFDSTVIDSMQGVLGLKPHVPRTIELDNFRKRWKKRLLQESPGMDRIEPNVFGLWAYDSVMALAMAIERDGIAQPGFKRPVTRENLTDLAAIGTSEMGPKLIQTIRNMKFKGLSGDFHLLDGHLQSSAFQIVNVIGKGEREIGFWTQRYGVSEKLDTHKNYTTNKDDLRAIIWPGDSTRVPKGWELPTGGQKLKVGIPVKGGFGEFVKLEKDHEKNTSNPTGFCIDMFEEVMASLPYGVPYEFIPFETPDGESAGDYDALLNQILLEKYDAVVGDVTILGYRSEVVDFTLPFTESGVSMIVPIKGSERKNAWIFMKPLKIDLWLTIGAFFIFTGFVVWVIEHRVNKEFRGPPSKQVGMIFWFSFSTLVFAHKEKITSNLTRFVVIVWMFVVLVLTSSYTANLASMLTVQQLQPTITNINDLLRNGEYVGYQEGSFVAGLLKSRNFDNSKLKSYSTFEEYDKALSKGSRNGGVAAIIDELPSIRLFLTKYCSKYTMIGPIYNTVGFGFAFRKGSPLVADVSRAILNVIEGEKMSRISQKWFKEEADCQEQNGAIITSDSLKLDNFKGLFLIAGISSSSALTMFFLIFLYEKRDILASDEAIWKKIVAMAKNFDEEKENSYDAPKQSKTTNEGTLMASLDAGQEDVMREEGLESPAISIFHNGNGIFSPDEGFSATEPGTPIHHTLDSIAIDKTTEER